MAIPSIDPIPGRTAHPGRELSFYVNAFDADDHTLTFALVGNPPDLAYIDPYTGRFSWTPSPQQLAGSPYMLTVQVSDEDANQATIAFTVTLNNQAPIVDPISNWTAYVNRELAFYVNARDAEGDALTFALATGPQGAYVDPNSGRFSWIPTALGVAQASVTVTDVNGGSTTSPAFTITVTSTPPTLDPLPTGLTAHPQRTLQFYAVGIDADGDQLTYALTQGPANAYIDPYSGLFTWTPEWNQWTAGQANIHLIEITVTDAAGQTQARQGSIVVVNSAPTIATIPARTALAGRMIQFHVNAFDADGDAVQFSLTNSPGNANIDPYSGLFSWTPPAAPLGAVAITVRAADAGGAFMDAQFAVTVTDDAPELETPPTRTGHPNQETTFYANAYDRDGDALTFRVTAGPAGASVDPYSGRFSWIPNWGQLGANQVTLEVLDPSNRTDSKQFTVVVSNQAPLVDAVPNRTVDAGATLDFYINASDPDAGDTLSFSLIGNVPPAAAIDLYSGYFYWSVPANTPAGAYAVSVRVSDGDRATEIQFVVTVNVPERGDEEK